jgi:hypothetical protein
MDELYLVLRTRTAPVELAGVNLTRALARWLLAGLPSDRAYGVNPGWTAAAMVGLASGPEAAALIRAPEAEFGQVREPFEYPFELLVRVAEMWWHCGPAGATLMYRPTTAGAPTRTAFPALSPGLLRQVAGLPEEVNRGE